MKRNNRKAVLVDRDSEGGPGADHTGETRTAITVVRNIPEIIECLEGAQHNTIHHNNYCKILTKLRRKVDEEAFKQSFSNALHYIFLHGDANGNVDRVLQFVGKFVAHTQDEDFLKYVFEIVFKCTAVAGHGVRLRACQLCGLILSSLGEEAALDDQICDQILTTQLERLQDVKGAVRCRAVTALQRLQDPFDESDPVTRAYLFHMRCDPSSAVRRAAVLNLAKGSRNLLHVMSRLCDVDESVRKAAFLYVSSISVSLLKVRQRVHILKIGLSERSLRVRRVVETVLLPSWLAAYQGNILELLAAVRLDNLQGAKDSATVAKNLLLSLFRHQHIMEMLEWLPIDHKVKLISDEKLTKESAWYWRHLVHYLHSQEDTDKLDQVLPELVVFTSYVRAFVNGKCPDPAEHPVEYSRRQYVLQELISIFPVFDMADEVGRQALQNFLYDTLTGNHGPLETDVIRAIIRAVDLVLPDITKRIEFVAGIISEIHEPAETMDAIPPGTPVESNEVKVMRTQLRVALNEALEEQEEAVRARDFTLAGLCKQKVDNIQRKLEELNAALKDTVQMKEPTTEIIREKKNDPETVNKCLVILNMLLDSPDIIKITPVLQSLLHNFEDILYEKVEIRENALITVTLYSLLDEEFARKQATFFFTQLMDMDNEPLITTTLKCLTDIMSVHGVQIFNLDLNDKNQQSYETQDDEDHNDDDDDDDEEIFSNISKMEKSKTKSRINKSIKKSKPKENTKDENDKMSDTHDTVIEIFLKLMNSDVTEYRFIVVEGLCKLMMAERLSSPNLVSRLLLLWFNPATANEDALRQILGTFFPLFAKTKEGQEQLEAAFLTTINILAEAPLNSPLCEIEHEAVLKFFISLTLPTVCSASHGVHSNLAVLIMNALERDPSGPSTNILCRALALLTPPRVAGLCQDLITAIQKIIPTIDDKTAYRNLSRYEATVCIALENLEKRPSHLNSSHVNQLRDSIDTIHDEPRQSASSDIQSVSSLSKIVWRGIRFDSGVSPSLSLSSITSIAF